MRAPIIVNDILKRDSGDSFTIVEKDDVVDMLFGMDHNKITDTDIEALKNGKCLYYDNGEYAQIISYEPQK